MDYVKLGQSELEVSRVCLGTMTFGEQTPEQDACQQLDYALAQGVNFIDTAELYAVPPRAQTQGASEEIVGRWLTRQPRDKIIIATKVTGPSRNLSWIRGGPSTLDESNITQALEGSLRRLKTDYIDLYQIHWPERNQPMFGQWQFNPEDEKTCTSIHEQLETLSKHVQAGKIRHIGVSNEHPWGISQFVTLAKQYSLPRIISTQNSYNLLNRIFEYGLAEVCYREQVNLLAYSPLAFGLLTGKYQANPETSGRLNLFPGFGQRYNKINVEPAVKAYNQLALDHQLTPTQLALSYVYSRAFVASTIIGASCLQQAQEDIRIWQTKLTPEVIMQIEEIHLRYSNPAP